MPLCNTPCAPPPTAPLAQAFLRQERFDGGLLALRGLVFRVSWAERGLTKTQRWRFFTALSLSFASQLLLLCLLVLGCQRQAGGLQAQLELVSQVTEKKN